MLLEYDKALKLMQKHTSSLGVEKINFTNSLNRVLSENIYSDIDMPPFDKSAMDGYACRKEDLANELEVLEIIGAGHEPKFSITKNQCSKIMTGAKIPQGADTVIVIEEVKEIGKGRVKYNLQKSKHNICYRGEDVKTKDLLIHKNTQIKAKHISVLSAVGKIEVEVYKKPKIAILSTGDELVEPQNKPKTSQIRNSNSYQLMAQVQELGIEAKYIGIAKDDKDDISRLIARAIDYADLIIVSGAVSVGDFDFVPQVLAENDFEFIFHGVSTKPGKHTLFGVNKNQYVIGVPGNPVSSFVQFQMLIKPLIEMLMSCYNGFEELKVELKEDFKRKKAGRLSFEPVAIKNNKVERINYSGSANITALIHADALMLVPKGVEEIKKGQYVYVRSI